MAEREGEEEKDKEGRREGEKLTNFREKGKMEASLTKNENSNVSGAKGTQVESSAEGVGSDEA